MPTDRQPVRVFFSYSHEDDAHRLRLEKALKLLERQRLIDIWSDRKLLGGDRWGEEIELGLERSDLILFLISPDFIASDFVWSKEVKRAMEREAAGEARVVPVIVRPCDWHSAPFGRLQAVPKDGLAVTHSRWGSEDEAWEDVAKRLRAVVEAVGQREQAPAKSRAAGVPPGEPDPTLYLEAVESSNSYVEIRGMGAQLAEQLPLDRVYTRLWVAGEGADEPAGGRGAQRGRLGLPEVLRRFRHAVLVGDPGSGKTTFLRFAAQILARSLLRNDPALAARELGLEGGEVPLPILVRLSRFAEYLRDHPDGSCPANASEHLLRYLDFSARSRNLGLPEGYLRKRVTAGGCFLLLDGLDEVPGALRPRVAAIVGELVATCPRDRYLITSRTSGYRGIAHLLDLPTYSLAPFSPDQVEVFVRGWTKALFQLPTHRTAGRSDSAVEAAERYQATLMEAVRSYGPWAESPLMLTITAIAQWSLKRIPERRGELYEEAISYMLETRREESRFPVPLRREALQTLALAMFTDEEGVQRSLGIFEAAREVAPRLQVSEEEARAFLDEESLQSGLLVRRSEEEVAFWLLSFQEYLVALELAAGRDYWDVLTEGSRLDDDSWSNVVLLLGGCLRRMGGLRAAKRFLERILARGADRISQARAVGLAGRVLTDILPYGGDPSDGTSYAATLGETLAIFEPGGGVVEEAVRVDVGEALGRAGDPRLATPEANRVEIPGGTFWMGAQKEDPGAPGYDPEAYDNESPVRLVTVSPFALGRYLVTVQEFQLFVEAGSEGYLDPRCWDPRGWDWRELGRYIEPGSWAEQLRHPNWPVTEVSWYEADAYCRWVGGVLPTEVEWEFAARGEEGRRYPWGPEEPDDQRGNFDLRIRQPSPVGIYPGGISPNGIRDLAGNVWEWCADSCGGDLNGYVKPTGPSPDPLRALRGGSFTFMAKGLRATTRLTGSPERRNRQIGIRVLWTSSPG